jgi:hypothetical protein
MVGTGRTPEKMKDRFFRRKTKTTLFVLRAIVVTRSPIDRL